MTKVKNHIILIVFMSIIGVFNSQAQQLYYSGSVQYSNGSYYFTETTSSLYVTNGMSLQQNGYSFSVSVPFVVQNSPWISYTQYGSIPTGGPQHGVVGGSGSGMGMSSGKGGRRISIPDTVSYNKSSFSDPTVSVGVPILSTTNVNMSTSLKIMGDLKIPLADPSQGFGTGEWDGGLGTAFSQRFSSWFVMLNAMYWWFGDMPDLELKDAFSYGAGIGKSIDAGNWMVLGTFSGMTRIIADADPPINAGMGITYSINPKNSLSTNATIGFNDSSADFTLGFGWQFRL